MIRIFKGAACLSAILLFVATYTLAALDDDIVFYLTFDTVNNQTVVDETGNGLNAEIHEHADIVKGKYGDAIQITAEGWNCINIPSNEKLKVTGEITMMAWIYSPEAWAGKKVHWINAVSPSDKAATTWADMKKRAVVP